MIIGEVESGGLYSLMCARTAVRELNANIDSAFGVSLPEARCFTRGGGATFISSGPEHWLVQLATDSADAANRLMKSSSGKAALVDQSDSRVVLALSGQRIREALSKGLPIDLHPSAFAAGNVAVTAISHIGVQIWQVSPEPQYRLAVPRSYFDSFWHWLWAAAAQYGGQVVAPSRDVQEPRDMT